MRFECDEFDVVQVGDRTYCTHSVLFSNGWEVRVPFHDVQVTLAQPIYPWSSAHAPAPVQSA
jgi:hypothetical protein